MLKDIHNGGLPIKFASIEGLIKGCLDSLPFCCCCEKKKWIKILLQVNKVPMMFTTGLKGSHTILE